MNESNFIKSIKKSYELFDNLGLSRSFTVPSSLNVNEAFNRLALDTSTNYQDLFFCGLKIGQYNFILKDLTYFQFSRKSEDDVRYAFYPSPFDPSVLKVIDQLTRARDIDVLDDEAFAVSIESLELNYRRPVIRYDYSPKQYKPVKHPTSHLHVGTYGEDRWCVERFLTPYAFSLQIAKMYFGDYWEALTVEEKDGTRRNELDDYLYAERSACKITPLDKFGSSDKKHFFFC
jgi:hypothetical protein